VPLQYFMHLGLNCCQDEQVASTWTLARTPEARSTNDHRQCGTTPYTLLVTRSVPGAPAV